MPSFRSLRTNRYSKIARTPLLKAVSVLIDVLDEVDCYPALYLNHQVLQRALFRYEHRWIPLLANVSARKRLTLVPPLDVEWVWICHMLCPDKYSTDSAAMWNAVRSDEEDYIVDHSLIPSNERHEGKRRAASEWVRMYQDESFDILQSLQKAPTCETNLIPQKKMVRRPRAPESRITCDIIAAAKQHMSFHYQVAIMPQYRDKYFLRHSVKRYKHMFLKLQKTFPDEIWVPTNDIDLVWRAHMLHPRWYKERTEKLCGSVICHDCSIFDRNAFSGQNGRMKATIDIWSVIFPKEPFVRGGGMWRGDVAPEERIINPRVEKLVHLVEGKAFTTVKKYSKLNPGNDASTGRAFSVKYGGDANWNNRELDWVHMTSMRQANRGNKVVPKRREDKVERVAFLRYADQPNLLTCRTLHFLIYNTQDRPFDFGSILEVYGAGASPNFPLATAHYALPNDLCSSEVPKTTACHVQSSEHTLLLRVGGKDYGILAAKWTLSREEGMKAKAPQEDKKGPAGQLELRLWLLGAHSMGRWIAFNRIASTDGEGRYSFELPVVDEGSTWNRASVQFDFGESTVSAKHKTHVIPAFLISMAAATLQVTLQPRSVKEEWLLSDSATQKYSERIAPQSQSDILRGAGANIKGKVRSRGLRIMLLQNMRASHVHLSTGRVRSFSGGVAYTKGYKSSLPGDPGRRSGGSLIPLDGDPTGSSASSKSAFNLGAYRTRKGRIPTCL